MCQFLRIVRPPFRNLKIPTSLIPKDFNHDSLYFYIIYTYAYTCIFVYDINIFIPHLFPSFINQESNNAWDCNSQSSSLHLGDMAANFCLDSAICESCEVELFPLKGWGPFIATNTTALIEKAKGWFLSLADVVVVTIMNLEPCKWN